MPSKLVRALLVCAVATVFAVAEEIPLQPFSIDHRGRMDSPADVSFLLDGPAGKDGFIQIKDGHLAKANGERFRIWGVNVTGWTRGSTNLPPKEEATLWAKTLAASVKRNNRDDNIFTKLEIRNPSRYFSRVAFQKQ